MCRATERKLLGSILSVCLWNEGRIPVGPAWRSLKRTCSISSEEIITSSIKIGPHWLKSNSSIMWPEQESVARYETGDVYEELRRAKSSADPRTCCSTELDDCTWDSLLEEIENEFQTGPLPGMKEKISLRFMLKLLFKRCFMIIQKTILQIR